jgi:hypothetical protein
MFKCAKSIGRYPSLDQRTSVSERRVTRAIATARLPRTRVTKGRRSENPLVAQKT